MKYPAIRAAIKPLIFAYWRNADLRRSAISAPRQAARISD